MSQVQICCPHCGFSRILSAAAIPESAKKATCKSCGQTFQLAEATAPVASTPPATEPSSAPQPAPATPPQAPAVDQRQTTEQRRINFTFHGSAKEYFGIWIVNTLLKVVTLGIYTPWAKVRKRRFFYENTQLEGMNFDYLANPIALLKGWLIAAALFLLYTFGGQFNPILSFIAGALIFILMPWAIVRSRLFNNRNSAHRNIRFNFNPDYKEAYVNFFFLPLTIPFTLGLIFPFITYRQKRFMVENNRFGRTSFSFTATGGEYYLIFLQIIGVAAVLGILFFATSSIFSSLFSDLESSSEFFFGFFTTLAFIIVLAFYLTVWVYYYVRTTNLAWNNTKLGRHKFESSLSVRRMAWIFLSNGVAILASCGLLTPWASIRLTRYRLANLTFIAHGDLESFRAANTTDISAVGEEFGDFFGDSLGMDIGL
ncbi:MAG: hypothetical protein C0622_12045 [Desulfuromonas sp.]|nr:MAG: hypothetical protein C0622_12045 [Desulfuromonas sp.]